MVICFHGPGEQANALSVLRSREQECENILGNWGESFFYQKAKNSLLHETCRPFWYVQ